MRSASLKHATCPAHLIFLALVILLIFDKNYKKLLIMQFSLVIYYFTPLKSKYSPQNHVLSHSSLSMRDSSFMSTQNYGQNYSLIHFVMPLDNRQEDKRF
jgi:hypothetical protein